MSKQSSGNGSGKFNIHQEDMGGWVRIFPDRGAASHEDLAVYLSHALTQWFRQRPHLRMRSVVPVMKDGGTGELHAWYELHVFPDVSGQQASPVPSES